MLEANTFNRVLFLEFSMDSTDYLELLSGLKNAPFAMGKKLLHAYLAGDITHQSVRKNNLDLLDDFGSLSYSYEEFCELVDFCFAKKFVRTKKIGYLTLLELTSTGKKELESPSAAKEVNFLYDTKVTAQDKKLFDQFDFFLKGLNDYQKKAVTDPSKSILCIAGAGTGKTRVLTMRIAFLCRFQGVLPANILAITFTRKARDEMLERLAQLGIYGVNIETFNSYCEKFLRENSSSVYGSAKKKVISQKQKFELVKIALADLDHNFSSATRIYFTKKQYKNEATENLASVFVGDVFTIIDKFKRDRKKMYDFSSVASYKDYDKAKLMYDVCFRIIKAFENQDFRDFTDQILDVVSYFESGGVVPEFDHVLVDEFQDVNQMQVDFLRFFEASKFFVGDPRQSIFGWRGSKVDHILNLENQDFDLINLTINYRSEASIVELSNKCIGSLRLKDLTAHKPKNKDMRLIGFESLEVELEFLVQRILTVKKGKTIFVLARTNSMIKECSLYLGGRGLKFQIAREGSDIKERIVLSSVHSSKGLEADVVFMIGCTSNNYPCKTSDQPVVDLVASEDYDSFEEEKRLFYVGMTRAKDSLYFTYTGTKPTYFLSQPMVDFIVGKSETTNSALLSELLSWRDAEAKKQGLMGRYVMKAQVLERIAKAKPKDELELQGIDDMTSNKIFHYGKKILRIVKKNKD